MARARHLIGRAIGYSMLGIAATYWLLVAALLVVLAIGATDLFWHWLRK